MTKVDQWARRYRAVDAMLRGRKRVSAREIGEVIAKQERWGRQGDWQRQRRAVGQTVGHILTVGGTLRDLGDGKFEVVT